MNRYEKALLGFETRAQKVISKYTIGNQHETVKYGSLRLSGFFGYFNSRYVLVDEELNRICIAIIKRYRQNNHDEFLNLVNGLHEQRIKARQQFISLQQPG